MTMFSNSIRAKFFINEGQKLGSFWLPVSKGLFQHKNFVHSQKVKKYTDTSWSTVSSMANNQETTISFYMANYFNYTIFSIQNHGIIEWFRFGKHFKDRLALNPLPLVGTIFTRPGCSKPHPAQPELFQGWSTYKFPGQHVPVPHHLHSEVFLLSILNLLFFSLKPFSLVPSLHALMKSPAPAFL